MGALVIAAVAWFGSTWVYLYSIPSDTPNKFNTSIRNLMLAVVFCFFWSLAFVNGALQMTIGAAVSKHYFNNAKVGSQIGVALGASVLLLCLVLFLRKRIDLTAALFRQTTLALQQTPSLLLTTCVYGALVIAAVAWFGST